MSIPCKKCKGRGEIVVKERTPNGLVLYRHRTCTRCFGHKIEAPRDPWTRPTLVFIAIVALYMAWQVSRYFTA